MFDLPCVDQAFFFQKKANKWTWMYERNFTT